MTNTQIKNWCPSGSLIDKAPQTFCDGIACTHDDVATCCEPLPPPAPSPDPTSPSPTGTPSPSSAGTSGSGTSGGGTTTGGGGPGTPAPGGTTTGGGTGTGGGTTSGGGTGTGVCVPKSQGSPKQNRVCKPTTCTCKNGTPATGPACIYNNAEYCLNCNRGFYHTVTMPGIASCKPCKSGFYQDEFKSTATQCKKWSVCCAADAEVGQSVVKHAIKIIGMSADTFNFDIHMKTAFTAAIGNILGVNEDFIQNVRAVSKKPDCKERSFLSASKESCFVLYELVFDTKQKADAMEAKIDDSTGPLQTDPKFTTALKDAMRQNSRPQNEIDSIKATIPDSTATEDKRLDGIDTNEDAKSSSTTNGGGSANSGSSANGGGSAPDISGDASTGDSPSGNSSNKDGSIGITIGVVFGVLFIVGVGIGAAWYYVGKKKKLKKYAGGECV